MSSTVQLNQGTLQGKECIDCNGKKYHSFEGIPYAKPPTGNLRFRDPQPPDCWEGIRDASQPGNKCAQMDPYGKKTLDGSEDCLYLNIYTPVLPAERTEKLPVLFFVHGGRFLVGQGDYYRPDYFMRHNVILVTINYRLHILGFLCLNIPEVPGNAAFKDVIMALKWVKNNIIHFNGDPNNVTAHGESAGAGLVSTFLTTKMADGLFSKIITQSGVCLSDLLMIEEDPIEKAKAVAAALGKELTDARSLYEFLINVPIEDLVFAATVVEISRPPYIINAYFLPVVEKEFDGVERCLEEFPLRTMLKNQQQKLPILVGANSHEGALFIRKNNEGNIDFITDVQRMIPRFMSIKYDSPKSRKIANILKQYYFKDKEISNDTKNQYIDMVSDAYFNRDILTFAETLSKSSKEIFLYNFCYSGNLNTRIMKSMGLDGATHGDIMPYLFYRENKAKLASEEDKKLIDFMTEAWCNFARNGKPTWTDQKLEWLPYTPEKRLCLNIDKELTVVQYPSWNRVKLWLDAMGERSKL